MSDIYLLEILLTDQTKKKSSLIHNKTPFRKSIFLKLLISIIVAGILINILVIMFFRSIFRSAQTGILSKNLNQYVQYIIRDLGSPPSFDKAFIKSKELSIQIRYESKSNSWSTSKNVFTLKEINTFKDFNINNSYFKRRQFIKVVPAEEGYLIFQLNLSRHRAEPDQTRIIILILFLSLILIGVYITIKRILKPIKLINQGVNEIISGNLDHQIKISSKDELGNLTFTFNKMTQQIKNMIYSKQQLLLNVSHELRSPITRMKISLEFLNNQKIKSNLKEDINEMEKMVTEIIETERLNSQYGQLNLQSQNIIQIIQEVISNMNNNPPGIILQTSEASLYLSLDRDRIITVFKNILDNALRYSSHQSDPIEISLQNDDNNLKVFIKDYGQGIPQNDLPYIFEPFYRVDKSRSKKTGGYGLGMSICLKIMKEHGGAIDISNNDSNGITVCLHFPKYMNTY